MRIYGEIIVRKLFEHSEIPADVRELSVPDFIKRRFGAVYRVSSLDEAMLQKDVPRALEILHEKVRTFLDGEERSAREVGLAPDQEVFRALEDRIVYRLLRDRYGELPTAASLLSSPQKENCRRIPFSPQ